MATTNVKVTDRVSATELYNMYNIYSMYIVHWCQLSIIYHILDSNMMAKALINLKKMFSGWKTTLIKGMSNKIFLQQKFLSSERAYEMVMKHILQIFHIFLRY
jgi:hypothetical protein